MNVLHINVAYICDKFYDLFYKYIYTQQIRQIVYTPYRSKDYTKENILEIKKRIPEVDKVLSPIKNLKDRLLYHSKISKYFNDAEDKLNFFKGIDIIHAHSLYTDGGVALKIYKKYGIPYIVAVRTTDTEKFMKYMKHLKKDMIDILENAKKIIFINHGIYNKLCKKIKDITIVKMINSKTEVIPNGVDDFWLNNSQQKEANRSFEQIRIIHVGRLIKRKNQILTIKAVKYLADRGCNIHLDIVGSGDNEKKLKRFCLKSNINNIVTFHGFVSDKEVLCRLIRQNDIFSLPSHTETFGVAYIEAMTQGLPIIFTRNQGIDGYTSCDVGCSVDSHNPIELANGIIRIISNYTEISNNCFSEAKKFSWSTIVNKYCEIYARIYMEGKSNDQ